MAHPLTRDIARPEIQLGEDVLEGRKDARDGAVVSQVLNTFIIRAVEVERCVKELEEVEECLYELKHRATQGLGSFVW